MHFVSLVSKFNTSITKTLLIISRHNSFSELPTPPLSPMSSPIRVGLVGLGQTTAELVPGGWGAKAHLPYLLSSPKYQLVAIANSSVQSAKSAIVFHKLDLEVKAYGSADELANDPEVDLVIVSVHVSKHYALTKPALLAGKDVFVEWPLGVTASEALELKSLADAKGVKTIVGAQGCASPIVTKVRELISTGQIGQVISSIVLGSFAPLPHDVWPQGVEYFLDLESGGNSLTISFGHCTSLQYCHPIKCLISVC